MLSPKWRVTLPTPYEQTFLFLSRVATQVTLLTHTVSTHTNMHSRAHRMILDFVFQPGNALRGIWANAKNMQDPEIKELARSLPQVVRSALAPTTREKYGGGWTNWQRWASSKPEVQEFPADPWYVAIFFNHLLQTNGTKGALHSAAYGIRWAHQASGLKSPLDDPFVTIVLQGCERLSAKPIQKKDPLTVSLVKELIDHYGPVEEIKDLKVLRFLVMVLVGFAGFFRIEEMLSTQLVNVSVKDDHMKIVLPQCKNDQMRKGNEVFVARTQSRYCPVALTETFWKKGGVDKNDETFLIPRLVTKKRGHVAHKSKGISYSTAHEQFKEFIKPLITDGQKFTPHSVRSGGASQAAASGVEERVISKHGRWRSERARNSYLEDTIENRLKVSRSLGL